MFLKNNLGHLKKYPKHTFKWKFREETYAELVLTDELEIVIISLEKIKEMIENSVLLYPNNIAFYEKENKEYKGITYSELYSDMVNLGNKLIDMGLKDKNIAIIGKNSYEWGLSYLTTVCGVGKVVPLDKELKKEELDKQLNNLNVDLIIYSKEQEKKLDHNKYKTIRMKDEMKEINGYETIKKLKNAR